VSEQADPLQRILDLEEIKQLKARYFRTLDTQAWDEFAQVFARDAVMEVPEASLVKRGREAIAASVSGVLKGARTVHHGHMPEIELTSETSATGIWAMFDYVELPEFTLQGYGHYHEEYVKRGGRWQIKSIRLTRLRCDVVPGAPSGGSGAA